MNELCKLLNTSDVRSALRWCSNKKLTVFSLCNKRVTYRFMVEIELDRLLIAQLKELHPESWEQLYQCYRDNDRTEYHYILEEKKEKATIKTKVLPKSKYAQEFYDQLNN